MSNLSVFEQNCMFALGGVPISSDGGFAADVPDLLEEMEAIFLRWKDRDVLKAERCAVEWATVGAFLKPLLPIAAAQHQGNPHAALSADETVSQVREFVKERLIRMHFPGNTTDHNRTVKR